MQILFLLISAFAAYPEPASLLRPLPSQVMRFEVVEFAPITAHHFSPEAPQNCGAGQITERSPRSIKCQFSQAGATHVILNVCDDKKTFCRPLEVAIQVIAGPTGEAQNLLKNESLNEELKHSLVPGFSEGAPEDVTKQSATRGQPVFLMISTDWCPPCNEAKEYLLSSGAFQKAAQNWFKVYVDGDSLHAADWEKSVPYRYFPTFVLLNSKMEEIGRYTGELYQSEFEAWAHEISGYMADPVADLKRRVLARRDGQWKQKLKDLWSGVSRDERSRQEARLLVWAMDQKDDTLVKRLLKDGDFPQIQPQILNFRLAELDEAEARDGESRKAQKIELTKLLLSATFSGDHWLSNLHSLCELDLNVCKPYIEKIPRRLEAMGARVGLTDAERESLLGDEYYSAAEIYQTLGDKKLFGEFARDCTAHFAAMKNKSFLRTSRAGQQGMVACLELAGDYAQEESALKALTEAYPAEPTFLMRMARMYKKAKKPTLALPWIERAESRAYGYNWFTLELLKADILLDLKKGRAAGAVLQEALAQVNLDGAQNSRNQRLVARLRSLQTKVAEIPE